MTSLWLWAPILMLQAGASTWASRARNRDSIPYHAFAAMVNHSVWFTSNSILVGSIIVMAREGGSLLLLGGFYTTFCVIGSITAHYLERRYGKRNDDSAA